MNIIPPPGLGHDKTKIGQLLTHYHVESLLYVDWFPKYSMPIWNENTKHQLVSLRNICFSAINYLSFDDPIKSEERMAWTLGNTKIVLFRYMAILKATDETNKLNRKDQGISGLSTEQTPRLCFSSDVHLNSLISHFLNYAQLPSFACIPKNSKTFRTSMWMLVANYRHWTYTVGIGVYGDFP